MANFSGALQHPTIVRGFAEMSTRLEVECPQCCDCFPVVVGVIEELEVMEITEGRENAVVYLRCRLVIHSRRISKHCGWRGF